MRELQQLVTEFAQARMQIMQQAEALNIFRQRAHAEIAALKKAAALAASKDGETVAREKQMALALEQEKEKRVSRRRHLTQRSPHC